MNIVRDPREMRALGDEARGGGRRIAFVPTMGFLHEGHLSLLREGRRRGDVLVLSIFVNPLQFGPGEDLAQYPRDEASDLEKARSCGVDVAYLPDASVMVPEGFQTTVEVRELESGLCGARRPGHFVGVATVVLKLFHQVRPHVALFGQKDYQQLQVIRRMTADLDLDIEIVSMPIVREPDGLALSSRNAYLNGDDRHRATAIWRGIEAARALAMRGESGAAKLCELVRGSLDEAGLRADYVEVRDATTLRPRDRIDGPCVLAVAAFCGSTRLIDNVLLP